MAQIGTITFNVALNIQGYSGYYSNTCDIIIACSGYYGASFVVASPGNQHNLGDNISTSPGVIVVPKAGGPAIILSGNFGLGQNTLTYYNGTEFVTETYPSSQALPTIPVYDNVEPGLTDVSVSTNSPGTTITVSVDGATNNIGNTPVTIPVTNGNISIDVMSHMPKDSYSLNINNGDNILKIVDGDTQYNSFPATITLNSNKAITAYGEPSPTITVNYENTSEPVITNS